MDNHYNHLRTLQAEFSESYRGAGIERSEAGSLWLKKPGKMRWEYRSPKEKLFLSDGKNAWFYLPGDRQVRRTSVKKLDDLRPPWPCFWAGPGWKRNWRACPLPTMWLR